MQTATRLVSIDLMDFGTYAFLLHMLHGKGFFFSLGESAL